MLVKKHKQARDCPVKAFFMNLKHPAKVLREFERKISHLDSSLHCELEAISDHCSSAALNVVPCKAKNNGEDVGSYQQSYHYKFQVFICREL